ncbi:hypothetical protein K469DRAFT_261548 [Zopfia rhizophila CBS 207.26]|uniref:Uncharacterized protein n=1 Tax=Zopfia rhizophila CBS 207.26 TaxID=1314779 RepID=A0A6A6DTH3_9PEZI|nr:hypothetical protein K469DRAFT_261548 [Zopfia rhizophila CBS 207.26]
MGWLFYACLHARLTDSGAHPLGCCQTRRSKSIDQSSYLTGDMPVDTGRIRGRARHIKSGWIKAGLYPFNPDRVLRDMTNPLAELTVLNADEVKVGTNPQGDVL